MKGKRIGLTILGFALSTIACTCGYLVFVRDLPQITLPMFLELVISLIWAITILAGIIGASILVTRWETQIPGGIYILLGFLVPLLSPLALALAIVVAILALIFAILYGIWLAIWHIGIKVIVVRGAKLGWRFLKSLWRLISART